MTLCPCQSGVAFDVCCGPLLAGGKARTAQALMRSRYTAYAQGDVAHLKRTLAPEHRGDFDPVEIAASMAQTQWIGLQILDTVDGGEVDDTGIVEFAARYLLRDGQIRVMQERSRFRRDAEAGWVYIDGAVDVTPAAKKADSKPGRNDPCPCGSGKKFKQCCGKT